MRPNRSDIAFSVLIAVLLTMLFVGLLPLGKSDGSSTTSHQLLQKTTVKSNSIVAENAHPGTSGWQISNGRGASTQIQAYASSTSVSPGESMTLYVSTQQEGTSYSLAIYRLGWYNGQGGRLMAVQVNQIGHAQGYYDAVTERLVNCTSCLVDTATGLVDANWKPSYVFTVPPDWTTGVYLAKFIDIAGWQTYVPFDVSGNLHASYVAVTSNTTYAAYNSWGGYSLYEFNSLKTGSVGRAVKVSLDRPYVQDFGSGYTLQFETDMIRWMERQGYDLSYMSSVDLHENAARLLSHRAYLSLGHDEYWSREMRDGVEYARDHGIGLAFLGANAAYWQIRFEPDSVGRQDRTIVCYKVESGHNDLARDPFYGKNNSSVTTQWRDPLLARPENSLIGVMYSGLADPERQQGFPWQLTTSALSPLLDGTGLKPGQQYGCDLVGYEWDRIFDNGATPAGIQVLGLSHPTDSSNQPDISHTTYYIAPSGAMVFATGSIYWTFAVDDYRFFTDNACVGKNRAVPGIQKLMVHVMNELRANELKRG